MQSASGTIDRRQRERLATGIDALGMALTGEQHDKLLQFLGLLVRWNAVYNLTSVRDPNDMVGLHLLDSLAVVRLVSEQGDGPIVDVGSGAGLPAIPLAIALPRRAIHSVDAVGKKVTFQREVKARLALSNLTPHHARVEALTLEESPATIVSRAFADVPRMLVTIARLATSETRVIAMKASEPTGELADLPPGWRHLETRVLDVPFIGADRCAVVLQRFP